MQIITKRPEGMSYKEYRQRRKEFTNWQRKRRKHGVLVYLASQIITEETPFGKVERRRTYMPAVVSHYDENGAVYKPMKRVELK